MKAIERYRQIWQDKSDEWLFERLDNELKQKIEVIHSLLAENEALRQFAVSGRSEQLVCLCKNRQDQFKRGDIWICGDCEEEIKQTNYH